MSLLARVAASGFLALAAPATAAPGRALVVEAGDTDRVATVVRFAVPDDLRGRPLALRDGGGRPIPLQVDDEGWGAFVLDRLPRGARARYHLAVRRQPAPRARAEARREPDSVRLVVDGRPVARYQAAGALPRADVPPEIRRGGYLHPLFAPSGRALTDDYPPNHLHHHGVWSAWAGTRFAGRAPDFWNMGSRTGRTDFEAIEATWQGPVHAGLRARQVMIDLGPAEPVTVLRETWRVITYRTHAGRPPYFLIDLESTQEAVGGAPLELTTYRYGGLGLRGHRDWNGPDKATFVTSERKGRADGHGTTARWCHMGGLVDGRPAGIAVLGAPDNFRAPQPMRIHPDEPFFSFAPCQTGAFTITPGTPYRARYRFVVADGPPDPALLDRLWADWADPPRVAIAP